MRVKVRSLARNRSRNVSGPEAFETYYETLFGARWPELRRALLAPACRVALTEGLLRPYFLDEASSAAAEALPLVAGDRVIDFCAAPGGKSLVLARHLRQDATLICNERSAARRARLHRVLDRHVPEELRRRISVTAHDATRWGLMQPTSCDKILLDVPCSSERHVMADESHLRRWSVSRSRRLAIQAFALLASAIDALVPGGMVLYLTCALTPAENDEVIAKAFRKRDGQVSLCPVQLAWGEATAYGVHVLPDAAQGRGPLYVCLLQKQMHAQRLPD